jgi:hypothetical protein
VKSPNFADALTLAFAAEYVEWNFAPADPRDSLIMQAPRDVFERDLDNIWEGAPWET